MVDGPINSQTQPTDVPGVADSVAVADVAEACPIDACTGRWWVVHTKSRNEKALAGDLGSLGIDHFLPLVQVKHRYASRVWSTEVPLFAGYLFMCGGDDEHYATLMTHRAAAIIRVVDQERLKTELRHVYLVTMSREPVDLYPGLRRGRRCRVTRGSLAGLEGVVLRRRGACRIFVGVEALGQSAELEIDPSLLEVID